MMPDDRLRQFARLFAVALGSLAYEGRCVELTVDPLPGEFWDDLVANLTALARSNLVTVTVQDGRITVLPPIDRMNPGS